MTELRSWKPILQNGLASRAWEALWQIADALAETDHTEAGPDDLSSSALLFSYLWKAGFGEQWAERSVQHLNWAGERATLLNGVGLHGGIAGFGWKFNHIASLLGIQENGMNAQAADMDDEALKAIDDLLISTLREKVWLRHYDLISGLVGLGIYFLDRLPSPPAHEAITLIIHHLESLAHLDEDGICWHTPADLVSNFVRDERPNGHFDLGVAHGIPGVIFLLGECCLSAIEPDKAMSLLRGAIAWMDSREDDGSDMYKYSCQYIPGGRKFGSRIGWCYGDLGYAAVLRYLSTYPNFSFLKGTSSRLLSHCSTWLPSDESIRDAPLCHGAIGVAHIWIRSYQAEPDGIWRDVAIRWYERALSLTRPGGNLGGFFAWHPDREQPFVADPSLLSGAVGVALALMAGLVPVEPLWDRALCLSRTGRAGATNILTK